MIDVSVNTCCKLKLVFYMFFHNGYMEIHLKENVHFHFSKLVPTIMFVKVKRFGAFISPSWLCKASICLFWLFTVRSLSSTSFVNLRFCSYRAAGPWQWETNVYVIDVYVIFVCFVLALFTVIDHSYRHSIWWGKLFFSFLARYHCPSYWINHEILSF